MDLLNDRHDQPCEFQQPPHLRQVQQTSERADDLSVTTRTVSAMKTTKPATRGRQQPAPTATDDAVTAGLDDPAQQAGQSGLGAVFTRAWAVDLVLDMAGYTAHRDLAAGLATEPSCGGGAFLRAMISRLADSCDRHGRDLAECAGAIQAWDLDPAAVEASRAIAKATLMEHGVTARTAARLARTWVREGDFLLQDCAPSDWVIGNPPYVRLEDVPPARSDAYRTRWDTMSGRADVYVGFIQAGLEALKPDGVLAFICADRWMRNQYGSRLRRQVENSFAVDTVITLHDSDAFEARVAAYPAVFALRRGVQGPAFIVDADATFEQSGARQVSADFAARPCAPLTSTGDGYSAAWTNSWFTNSPSWPTGKPERISRVTELEARHAAIGDAESGIRLGIGIASGADAVYLTNDPDVVEDDRLLPIAMGSDLRDGKIEWSGTYLVNPWQGKSVIDLDDFPRTSAYFRKHEARLKARHVGRRQPDRWYRTIDRPVDGLAATPKLLVADLRHRVAPVLDEQGLYPHHNLFWLTSDTWDLRVLGGLLLSDYGTLFVETYSPRMAGGALRVTAQYLRRIRIPAWGSIDVPTRNGLITAFEARDVQAATRAAEVAYA